MKNISKLLILVSIFGLLGCPSFMNKFKDVEDGFKQSVALLTVAIDRLERNSEDWQRTLGELQNNLTEDTQKILKQEVNDILSRSIAGTGSEVRCILDFTGIRIKQQLENIRARLLNIPQKPFYPSVCSTVPSGGITLNEARNPTTERFEMYGFDFIDTKNSEKIKAYLEDESGNLTEVTQFLNTPTNYMMTLNIGGIGVKFSEKSKQLIVKGQTLVSDTLDYTTLYTIGVFQPLLKSCETKTIHFTPNSFTYIPPHTRGDQEFNGHGPRVWFETQLINYETHVNARIHMKAEETRRDHTTAEGTIEITVYTAPSNFRINKILGSSVSRHHYEDSNHGSDIFNLSGPVAQARFIGDTRHSNDAGVHTKVDVTFSQLTVEIEEIDNCSPIVR